jgi:hypothetical protein
MKILERLFNRSPREEAGDPGPAEANSPDSAQLPIRGYDKLDDKEIWARLPELSQVELVAVETYERAHQDRPVVLQKLNWLQNSEPLAGYDALETDEIVRALSDGDAETVKSVREYERHHQNRGTVRAEVARVLPSSQASAGEEHAREQQKELVREGLAGREKTAGGLASGRSAPDG